MDLSEFNDVPVQPQAKREYPVIQPGTYTVQILSEETKPTRAGTGSYLELVYQIQGGTFNGQRIWDRLNLKNPSTKAVEIALAALRSIQRCCGIDRLSSSADLVGHTMKVKTRIEEFNDKENARVVEYLSHGEVQPNVVNPQPGREFMDDMPF